MKKFIAVFCLLLCAATLQAKEKPNPADLNIKIHISASENTPNPGFPFTVDAVLNGKKVKLGGGASPSHSLSSWSVINPGDYQIRLKKDKSEKDNIIISQEYELLLPNGETWDCWIVGISE
jgi:hypothetical protein